MQRPIPLLCLALSPLILVDAAPAEQPAGTFGLARDAEGCPCQAGGDLGGTPPSGADGPCAAAALRQGQNARGTDPWPWMNPGSWNRMVEKLEEDPILRRRYQFWTFGNSTGDPISHSAHLLRRDLDEARRILDPSWSDGAFDRMVIVGHSSGGPLAKMMRGRNGDIPGGRNGDRGGGPGRGAERWPASHPPAVRPRSVAHYRGGPSKDLLGAGLVPSGLRALGFSCGVFAC